MKSMLKLQILGGAVVAGLVVYVVYRAQKAGTSLLEAAKAAPAELLNAINPANPDNVFAQVVNAGTRAVTGAPTFGAFAADVGQSDPNVLFDKFAALRRQVTRGSYTAADLTRYYAAARAANVATVGGPADDLETAQFKATTGYY
jgi:hypothetical protein